MKGKFTLDDLILYLYNETEMTDSVLVQKAIDTDEEVSAYFQDLVSVKELLDSSTLKPSKSTINAIMQHAREKVTH